MEIINFKKKKKLIIFSFSLCMFIQGVSILQTESSINSTWHYSIGGMECTGTETHLVDCTWTTDNMADDMPTCPYAAIKCFSSM